MKQNLATIDHSRDIVGLKYIYPVISRRAGGLSIGINFNTNNACNWRCVYCQVPDLVRGSAPVLDIFVLEKELRSFLEQVLKGDFFEQFEVPESQRVIKDIAISGNGEPTSLKNFDKAIDSIGRIAMEMGVLPGSNFVLISNGSLMHQQRVQEGLKVLNKHKGQVWYKLDSATKQGRITINDSKQTNDKILENLKITSTLCETRLQTCVLEYLPFDEEKECIAYIELLKEIKLNKIEMNKIMLYTLARPSLQPEASLLSKVDEVKMNEFSEKIRQLGFEVSISL